VRLLFLHGVAAAGKLTTARELSARLNYPVFHNHLVVDLLTEMFPFGSPPFVRLREEFWLSVFGAAAESGPSLIFTFAPEATVTPGFPGRARTVVQAGGGWVHFVRLKVSSAEQDQRIGNPDRREFHKLTDLAALRHHRESGALAEQPPFDLEIDTDHSRPGQTARAIIARFQLTPEPVRSRYPNATGRRPDPGS